jgi:flagella basal body P-ring formation protein FlgA
MNFSRAAAGVFLVLAAAGAALAGAKEDAGAVAAAVRQAALGIAPPRATVTLGPVYGAAFMPACSQALSVSMGGVAPYEQAAAHCAAPAWTLYVTVTVAMTQPVVVAARPIVAGQILSPGDLVLTSESVALYAGRIVFYDPVSLRGASAVMSLAAGSIITSNDVVAPVVVESGQTVTVQVQSGGVRISVVAVADQMGRVGDTILFTNPASGRLICSRERRKNCFF